MRLGRAGPDHNTAPHACWAKPFGAAFALLLKLDFSAQQGGNCFFNRAQPSNKHDVRENVPALSSPFTENQPYWVAFRSESRLLRKIYFFFR